MPAPLSIDLRRRIVEAVADGSSIRAAARRFAVSPSAAIKLMQRVRATGSPAPARFGGYRRPVLEPHRAELERLVAAQADLTLAELQDRLQRRCGIRVGLSTLHVTLHRLGLRHKKRMARPICKGDERRRAGLHQRIRSQGTGPGQDGSRASRAS